MGVTKQSILEEYGKNLINCIQKMIPTLMSEILFSPLPKSSSCRAISTDIADPLSPHYLSSIASGRSSGLHPVSTQSCCMLVRAGRPAFARLCEGVHMSLSLMSSSLLLQQCPACLVRLILIVFVTGGR